VITAQIASADVIEGLELGPVPLQGKAESVELWSVERVPTEVG